MISSASHICWQELEDYITKIDGFNTNERPWSNYQTGSGEYTNSYRLRAPLFMHVKDKETKPPLTGKEHPWLKEATRKLKFLYPNPNPPRVLAFKKGKLIDIADTAEKRLMRGDIVWFTFSAAYVVGPNGWHPYFVPIELVRVAKADWSNVPDYSVRSVDMTVRSNLQAGERNEGVLTLRT